MTTVHVRIGEDSWHLNHRCRSVSDDRSYAAALDGLRSDKGSHWEEGRAGRVSKKHPTPFRYKRECAVTLKPTPTHCNTDPLNTSDGIKSSFFSGFFCFFSKPGTVKTNPARVSQAGLRLHRDNCNHFSGQCFWMQKEAEQSSWCLQVSVHVSNEITERTVYISREYSLLRKVKQALTTSCNLVSPVLSHILDLVCFWVFSQGMPNNVCFYFLQLLQISTTFQHSWIWNRHFP